MRVDARAWTSEETHPTKLWKRHRIRWPPRCRTRITRRCAHDHQSRRDDSPSAPTWRSTMAWNASDSHGRCCEYDSSAETECLNRRRTFPDPDPREWIVRSELCGAEATLRNGISTADVRFSNSW